jgi:hypothetical protein
MGKNKKIKESDIKLVEEGFEDERAKTIAEIRKEIKEAKEEKNKPKTPINPIKLLAIICVWIFLFRQFINWGFGSVFISASILVLIFANLGKRKPWELSAYSVFNRNFERLPGTLNLNDIQPGIGLDRPEEENFNNVIENVPVNDELNRLRNVNRYNVDYRNNVAYDTKHEKIKSDIKEKASQSLNSACNCGSNKKYKNCCAKNDLKEE